MQAQTRIIVQAAIGADSSISASERKSILAAFEGNGINQADRLPRIVKRAEVATLLGVSTKRCDQLAKAGVLARITAPGTSRAIGYSEESVKALVEGRAAGKAVANG